MQIKINLGQNYYKFSIPDEVLDKYSHLNPKNIEVNSYYYFTYTFLIEKLFLHYDPSIISIKNFYIAIK